MKSEDDIADYVVEIVGGVLMVITAILFMLTAMMAVANWLT